MTTTDAPAPPFDADAWLAASAPTRAYVTLRQRPDLVAVVQDLQHRLKVAEAVPDAQRDDADETPDDLHRALAELHEQWEAASLRVAVEARSSRALEAVRRTIPRDDRTDDTVVLHHVADAIVEPTGITVDWLRGFRERHPAQFTALVVACGRVNTRVPEMPRP